jgi:hypothetical protein
MVNIQLSIRNPWSNKFHNYKCYTWQVSENKAIEIEFLKSADIVDLHLSITHRQSHAGVDFELGLLGYNFHFMFYDIRHWDYILKRWETYDEESNSKADH